MISHHKGRTDSECYEEGAEENILPRLEAKDGENQYDDYLHNLYASELEWIQQDHSKPCYCSNQTGNTLRTSNVTLSIDISTRLAHFLSKAL